MRNVPQFQNKNGSIFPHAIFFPIWEYISLFGLMRKRWQKVLPFHLAATSFSLVFFPYAKCCSISFFFPWHFPACEILLNLEIYFVIWPYAKTMAEDSSFSPRADLIFSSIFPLCEIVLNSSSSSSSSRSSSSM